MTAWIYLDFKKSYTYCLLTILFHLICIYFLNISDLFAVKGGGTAATYEHCSEAEQLHRKKVAEC